MANKIKFSSLDTLNLEDLNFDNAIIPLVQDGENFKVLIDNLQSPRSRDVFTTVQTFSGGWSGGVIQGTDLSVFNLRSNKQRSFVEGGGRGEGSVDLQTSRETETQVASGEDSVIGGGINNQAAGNRDTVAGGKNNSTSDPLGFNNFIGGGENNSIVGYANTIPGGTNNTISGNYSFATGQSAQAMHDGATVFSGTGSTAFSSLSPNSFNIRAVNGLRLVDGNESDGKVLTCDDNGTGTWQSPIPTFEPGGVGAVISDVQTKLRERITPADFGAVGDGTADDTSAIQAAIDHAESLCDVEYSDVGAGYIQVDLGGLLYRVTSTLTINRKIKFGNGNLIVTTDFPAGDGTDSCVIYVSDFATERLIIHDLDIDCGLDVSDSTKRSNGIYATQCQRCLFTNINVIHMREFGIYITRVQGGRFENMILNEWTGADKNTVPTNNGIEDYTYRTAICLSVDTNDCLFSNINCSHGLYPMKSDKGSANLWNNCHFVTAPTEGVGHVCVWLKTDTVAGTYAVGNMFTGCYFDNGEVLIENGFFNSFTSCKFIDSSVQQGLPATSVDTAIRFKATEANKTVDGVVIVGCIFTNVTPQFTKTVSGAGSWAGVDSISVIGSLKDGGDLPDNYQITNGLYWDNDKLVASPKSNDYELEIANRLTTFSAHADRSTGYTASRWGNGSEPVIFVGAKSRGDTIGTFGTGYLLEGDPVARFGGVADRGADFGNNAASSSGGYIQFEADGAHDSFDTPFRMVTYLTPDGSAANASEVARIHNNGQQEITLVQDTAANISDASSAINTSRKRQGLMLFDTTNNRIMVASGSADTDEWFVADGSSSVTPA